MTNKKLFGFTLAEVLITLAIIGVVAALTLPTLMSNYKKHEYSTKLKKFYASTTQALRISEAESGVSGFDKDGGIKGDIMNDEGKVNIEANAKVLKNFVNKYLSHTLNIASMDSCPPDEEWCGGEAYFVLNDGSYVFLHNGNCIDFIYDVNGLNSPNIEGIDRYRFILCPQAQCERDDTHPCGMLIHPAKGDITRDEALRFCESRGYYCSSLLYLDGFEYKSDYPHKF